MASIETLLEKKRLLDRIWGNFSRALDLGHDAYTKRARYLENMYLGGGRQWWSEAEKVEELEEAGKPVLELNLIGSDIRRLKGYQTQSRMNIAYEPRGEGADLVVSEILSKIALFELDQNRFPWVESQVFEDGIVQQRGYFDIRMDYEEDLKGRIKITSLDPLDVIPDPDAKSYDPKDWNRVTITKWLPLETIKALYPGKYKAVKQTMNSSENDWGSGANEGVERNTFSQPHSRFNYWCAGEDEYYVRVLDTQYYQVVRRNFFYDQDSDTLIPVPDEYTVAQAKREAKQMGYEIVPRTVKRIKWTICTRDVLLHDEWSPYDYYTVVPFFPIFRRGQTLSLVDNLITNQEAVNKAHSQFLHIINSTANSGWITQEGSLVNMDDEDLEQEGASTGLHIVYKRGYDKPEKIVPNQIPSGLSEFLQTSIAIHDRLLGVSEAFRGDRSNEVSGRALQERVNQTAVGLSSVIDNLFYTRNILARILLYMIQNFYTEERTFRIVVDRPTGEEEEIKINYEDEISGIMNDITIGKYDVVISDVPTQINYQQGQLAEALEFRKYGVAIPDDEMVRLSTLTRKDEIAKRMSGEGNEAQAQMQEMQMKQFESQLRETNAKAEKTEQDTIKLAADVAKMIAENPAVASIMQQIIAMNPPAAIERQEMEAVNQQQGLDSDIDKAILGQY
jgi:hypothetical protein